MTGSHTRAVEVRIKKANRTGKQVNRKIFINMAFSRKIKILLWNSMVRSTMIYGLHTKGLPSHMLEKIEAYMYKHIRTMIDPQWKVDAGYTGKNQIYKKLQQSEMEAWINQTQIMAMTTQTHDAQTIHPKGRKEMIIPRMELQKQWGQRHQAIREHITKIPEAE